jgi:hypothetical protein
VDFEAEAVGEKGLLHEMDFAITVLARELFQIRVVVIADLGVDVPASVEEGIGAANELGVRVRAVGSSD